MVSNKEGMQMMPQFILQMYDFEKFQLVQNVKTLNRQFDGFTLVLDKHSHVFKIQTTTPVGYNLWINSNCQFQTMSIQNYITKNLNYSLKSFQFEHISGEKDNYTIFGKIKISCVQKQDIIVRLRSQADPDPFITKYLRLKLVKENLALESQMQTGYEGVEKNGFVKSFLNITDYTKIPLEKQNYNLTIEGIIPFTFPDGKLDLEVFFVNEIQLEQLEFVEPTEY